MRFLTRVHVGLMPQPTRLRMAVVVVGGTMAILALGTIQVAFPLLFGPWGLAATILIDLDVVLFFWRHAALRKVSWRTPRYPLVKFGPVDRRYATRRVDDLELETTATAAVTAVILTIYVVSRVLYQTTTDFSVFFVAGMMLLATVRIAAGLLFMPLPSEAELWDTTDDH